MKAISSQEMRELDRTAIEKFGVPGNELMDRAGRRVAEVVRSVLSLSGNPGGRVLVFAGQGNNGGDAFVTAHYLKERGIPAEVFIAGERGMIRGDARNHMEAMTSSGVLPRELPTEEAVRSLKIEPPPWRGVIVDGVLGTGAKGAPRGTAAAAIGLINRLGQRNKVVAIDIPSGLDADTGEVAGEAVRADITVTMGLPKKGLLMPCAIEYVGSVEVADIGIPQELAAEADSSIELITAQDLRKIIPARKRSSHKGDFGHVLVIGGAPGYLGAAVMAAKAALRSGAGLVSLLAPAGIAHVAAGLVPEAMVHAGSETDAGTLSADCLKMWSKGLDGFDAVLAGPGMTTQEQSVRLVQMLIGTVRSVLVLDADAVNCLGTDPGSPRKAVCPVILTPHPGEMGTLLGCSAADVQKARFDMACKAAELAGNVVVLKGAGTVVTGPSKPVYVNLTGNPGMATGGAGDVLSGLIAGLAAQGMSPLDAACAGVYLHGKAGDNIALRRSQAGLTALDLIEEIPAAFSEIAAR